jgi:hypothetical protein
LDNGIGMHLQSIFTVFEFVAERVHGIRKFAWFANWNEGCVKTQCQGGCKDETASFRGNDDIDFFVGIMRSKTIDGSLESLWGGEQRGDVFKQDTGFGKIGYVANKALQVNHGERFLPNMCYQAASLSRVSGKYFFAFIPETQVNLCRSLWVVPRYENDSYLIGRKYTGYEF